MTKPSSNIRLTITVTAEVHEAFTRLAKASGMSLGRSMGTWLEDTLDAARFQADTMERARSAPRVVARELHAYAMGLQDETGAFMKHIQELGAGGGPTRGAGVPAPNVRLREYLPPSSNTGGKLPKVVQGKHGGKR